MAPQLIIRLGKRRSSWEKTDPRDIAEVEFQDRSTGGFDLRPSVYVLDEASLVVRVRAEHSASCISPPRPTQSTIEFNVAGATAAPTQPSPGETSFAFANSAHAELLLADEAELLALVGQLLTQRAQREIAVTGSEVLTYVDERLTAGDPEWVALISPNGPEQGDWGKAIVAFRRKRAPPP